MTPRRQPERLEKRLARVARELGVDQERLRRWVSFLALCGVLERALAEKLLASYHLKGGVALELRFAGRARATKDLDLGMEGPRAGRLDALRKALQSGFDDFAFRVKAGGREMQLADTVRVEVAVIYRTRPWQTIEVDLGPGAKSAIDLVHPCVQGLEELGLPVTSPVRCLSLPEQVAQKIHACTSPHSGGRARDILDILLIDSSGRLDYAATKANAHRVFAERATHGFPSGFTVPPAWRPELEAMAEELGLAETNWIAIETRFDGVLRRLARS
jgi:Nucleotidyl transferase AbiEii toxin, Type IV TA system